jgi:heat-inducible transcriptional repressor
VPTEAAFRLFIDALMRLQQLSPEDASRISGWLGDLPPGADILRGAGRLLSDMTGAAAVLVRSPAPERTLSTIRFIRTRPGELLSVLVFSDGSVENRFVRADPAPAEQEIERLHNMLHEVVEGRTLGGVRDHFARTVDEQKGEVVRLQQMGVALLDAAIDASSGRPEIIIEGRSRLFERPEFGTAERLRELVNALDEREQLVALLDSIIETDRVQVLLGGETEQRVGVAVSLVAAPYRADGRPGGAVGVIGPVAMDYPTVIPAVRATAEAMSAALARTRG